MAIIQAGRTTMITGGGKNPSSFDVHDPEAVRSFLESAAKHFGTDVTQEERVLSAALAAGMTTHPDGITVSGSKAITAIAAFFGKDVYDTSPNQTVRVPNPSVTHLIELHQDMRERMAIGPLLERNDRFHFANQADQQEYSQALTGLRTAFLSLREARSEQEWSSRFNISETEVRGGSPIVNISGNADGASFLRQYLPDAQGNYNGSGTMTVTSAGAEGSTVRQTFTIDSNLNVALASDGDPTNNASPAFRAPPSLLRN